MILGPLFALARPVLRALDPETAHRLTLRGLALAPFRAPPPDDPRLGVEAFGLRFPNPIGLAAGFDKQAEATDALLSLGFGFVELGGVVPKPQGGNPRPRVFRLPRDEAVINRYGLNSDGVEAVRERLLRRGDRPGIVGVNIGANKDAADRLADYVTCIRRLTGLVAFLTVNVSSPNTPGLRDLQGERILDDLLARCVEARDGGDAAAKGRRTSILLKIAPDIAPDALDAIAATALRRNIDGLIVSNTTVARPEGLRETALAKEAGGLSGKPVFAMATRLLAEAHLRLEGRLALVGVGGVDSGEAAWTKLRAGASVVQLYSALIYQGPGLVAAIKRDLVARLVREGLSSVTPVVGRDAARIAKGEFEEG